MGNQIRIGNKAVRPTANQVKIRYDLGKYAKNPAGLVIDAHDGVSAIWAFRGKDKDGPYYGLMCVSRR
jgi:hypothetical protein